MIPHAITIGSAEPKGKCLIAKDTIAKGTMLFIFKGILLPSEKASDFALQVDKNLFLESTEEFENYLNHSCDPNCVIDFTRGRHRPQLIALQNIQRGEELSFDYDSTEYDLVDQECSFNCHCQSKNCRKKIKGFRYLTRLQKKGIKDLLSPFLKEVYVQELQKSGRLQRQPTVYSAEEANL